MITDAARPGATASRIISALLVVAVLPGCSLLEPEIGSQPQTLSGDQGAGQEAAAADASPETVLACGTITAAGCCDGETLWWCRQGALAHKSCAGLPSCGWSNSKIYDCNTSGVSDPSGAHFMQCGALTGDGGVPTSDGAGSDGGGCGGIKQEGCCAGDTLRYCEGGKLRTLRCELNPRCGWLPNGQYYDCGTAGGADPTGNHPMACPGTTAADLGPDLWPDGTGDAVLDLAGEVASGEKDGCSCAVGSGSSSAMVLLMLVLLASGRRRGA